jgi:di/tricarboxylate transporter
VNWEIIFVIILLIGATISFITEKISPDQTSIFVFALLMVAGAMPFSHTLPKIDDLLTVFSSSAPLTIAAMFAISNALERTSVLESIAAFLSRFAKLGFRPILFTMIIAVAFVSAFINNTPVVVIFLPVVLSLARQMNVPASKMLIPLSYASIFGGTCTLVGTSTNILASDIMTRSGLAPLTMFEIAWVGIPLLVISALYITFFGNKLLPIRETITSMLTDDQRREYIVDAALQKDSPLVGKTPHQAKLSQRHIRVVDILRNGIELEGDLRHIIMEPGDRLILSCKPSGVAHARSMEGLDFEVEQQLGMDTISAHEGAILEGVVGPRSNLVGKSAGEFNFRQRYQMVLLAVHRRGQNLGRDTHNIPFEFGDTLLMMGTNKARERLRSSEDIMLLDQPRTPSKTLLGKAPIVISVIVGMILCVSFGILPIVAGSIIGLAILFLTKCITPKESYDSVDWSIILLIYGMLGLGIAMESTGTSKLIANGLVELASFSIPPDIKPLVLLAAVYLVTTIFTEFLSNNAAVVLMIPIAINLAGVLACDPRPFAIATCIAASASFSTPIGYQTNTYVYSVGGYKFKDFLKIGIPLNVVYFIVSVIFIPIVWPLK